MKKTFKIAFTIIVILCSIASISLAAAIEARIIKNTSLKFFFANEWVCYVLCLLSFTLIFAWLSKKVRLTGKSILAIAGSILCMTEVFFINNLLRYMEWASWLGFDDAPGYWYFLKWDFNYDMGLGKFRYILVFLIQLLLFAIVVFLQSDLWRKIKQDTLDKFSPNKE